MTAYAFPIGVIGGLGPLAGAAFYRHLVEAAGPVDDSGHPETVLLSDPAIPSRLDHLLGHGPSPLPRLVSVARRLADMGCGVLALTSITTHAYYDALSARVGVPIVDARAAVARAVAESGARRPALAGTGPARRLGLLDAPLRAAGLDPVHPDDAAQRELDALVREVKARGVTPDAVRRLTRILSGGWRADADALVIACTDLSPLAEAVPGAHDVSRVLARAVLDRARATAPAARP
ncbi:aspartate/glutamate racemase family protein [Actinocorallia sp. A-T 12471]|uniref:aspartate/glutamate racemase family protein n=1 Tax=Actinocorallia sp. A-T 12471 TaxID=3089813 RepID=UPI0029CC3B7F|nr:amino acid racemase [Actinocorallia sp. A-T 12471]MDX6742364.1 amino acid racemase [Actinocorallia sp. A-T 12471]